MRDRLTETVSPAGEPPIECFTFRVILAPRDDVPSGIPVATVAHDFDGVLTDVCSRYGLAIKGYGPVGYAEKNHKPKG